MPSVGMQMPVLYLRGSLCNQTMVNLEDYQIEILSEIVDEVIDDPLLQPTRIQFRNALRYTIKGDYESVEAADQEYQIAIWKAATAAKFGWGKHQPSEEAIADPLQRKKFFQTWVFNYLRQILNENKKPARKVKKTIEVTTIEACKTDLVGLLKDKCRIMKEHSKECEIFCNLFMLPSRTIDELSNLKLKYFTKGIEFSLNSDNITIKNTKEDGVEMIEVQTKSTINTVSTSSNDDEEKSIPELASMNTDEFQDPDTIQNFMDNLSEDAQKVIKTIMAPSDDYIEKYGEKPVKKYIAEYLGFSNKQIKEVWAELRMVYCHTIGIPDID